MARTRHTRQKAAVLAAVKGASHHPDAKWVYEQVSREIPNVSLGTVYRALASLSAEGLIREYTQAGGPALYDPNTEEHFHIRCSRCGCIEDVPHVDVSKEIDKMIERIRPISSFDRVDEVQLEFEGICSACAKEPAEPKRN